MEILRLQVRMLGEFSIRLGNQEINDNDNRSKKVWLLLAYMIYHRNRIVTQTELAGLLWGEDERSSNPLNALKTMFHRVRATLNQLDVSAGHSLIIRRDGNYAWNTETTIPLTFDIDDFENLCRKGDAAATEEKQLDLYLQALELYQGDFLQKLSSEPWVVPIAAYFHNLYVRTALAALTLLEVRGRKEEVASLARRALVLEPYNEEIYRFLLQALLNMGDQRSAITVYEEMSEMLFSNFGIMPNEELRALYRAAARTINDRALSIMLLMEQLRESDGPRGALMCDYDFFKILYHAEARAVTRSGDAVHIGLLTVTAQDGSELSKRSLDRCMENLEELVRKNLRRGDIASRCSISQFILMLPQANYENSCKVCDRVVKSFFRQYPHSPARIHFNVQPLEPNL